MLRTIALSVIALIGTASLASAEDRRVTRPESPMGVEVRADDGTVLGHVGRVERNRNGRVVAAEVAGLEPADAPRAGSDLVAQNDVRLSAYTRERNGGGIFESGQTRSR